MPRLFVDMDGTLAQWHELPGPEPLFEPGYFLNLEPMSNVIAAIKDIAANHPEIELHILSAVVDSPFSIAEKNAWLDKFLPDIPADHRIYLPCGADKTLAIPGGIKLQDFLLDDYNHNLSMWVPPTHGIKVFNGINDRHKSWQHSRVDAAAYPTQIVSSILNIMEGQIEKEGVSKMAKNAVAINKNPNEEQSPHEFEYQLLDRLRTDCNYFLGNGNRMGKNLWAGSVEKQISKMRELYNLLPEKPDWLSLQDIDNYEKQMMEGSPSKVNEKSKEPVPDDCLTCETIATPRGFCFHVTSLNKEQMQAAGFSYHHSSDDGKYDIMTNGTTAYAVSAQQPEKTKHKSKGIER